MKSKKDARKYQRLFADAIICCQIEKRRTKLEELNGDFYSNMLEWITDYIFTKNWKDEELKAKIEEFRAFRHRKYEELFKEREELRNLELVVNGHHKQFEVY